MPVIIPIAAEIPLRRLRCFAYNADQHIKGVDVRVKCEQAFQHLWDLLFCNEWFLLLKALHQTAGLAAFCAADFDPEDRILCQ